MCCSACPTTTGWSWSRRVYNLVANPRASIVIGGVSRVVIAHELDGAERERYYERGIDLYPGFSLYRRRAHRRIPVLALDPVTKS